MRSHSKKAARPASAANSPHGCWSAGLSPTAGAGRIAAAKQFALAMTLLKRMGERETRRIAGAYYLVVENDPESAILLTWLYTRGV